MKRRNSRARSMFKTPCSLIFFFFFIALACKPGSEVNEVGKPNIVIFYVDDLGYGDLSSYGAVGVNTPSVDKLAAGGIKFTDGHSPAATCTPSRYSLLTGEYAFRNNVGILKGDAPLLIDPTKPTLPGMLKKAGYHTAVVGKWHLGLGNGNLNWNEEVKPGPLEVGFDYSFLLPATGDRVPTVYLEDYVVVGLNPEDPIEVSYGAKVGNRPTGRERPDLLRFKADRQHSQTIVNGVSRIGTMAGGESALWVDEEFPDVFTSKAIDYIQEHQNEPFFLFFSFHDIHVPRLPNERFQGKSTMGPRGDAIVQMDWMTGQIVTSLEELGLDKNTLILFTSDNGPVLNDGYEDEAVEKLGAHRPAGPFSGGKYSILEAGTRVPTIAYWPETISPAESNALISQVDLYASLASIVDQPLSAGEAPDSENLAKVLLGESQQGREFMLEEAVSLGLRHGKWKYIPPQSKDKKIPGGISRKGIAHGLSYVPQLYNLETDPGETINLAEEEEELVRLLQAKLDEIINRP